MMTVKCKTPFAKQAVICRTTHLGKPKEIYSCSKAENPPFASSPEKEKAHKTREEGENITGNTYTFHQDHC